MLPGFKPYHKMQQQSIGGGGNSPMGTMGVPPSVLYSMPVSVCTSKSGFFLIKNSGFPQPAGLLGLSNSRHL